MCTTITETGTQVAARYLIIQARCGLGPGYQFLSQRVRLVEDGLTHPHFALTGEQERVSLSAISEQQARILLAWATWLLLCGELSHPELPAILEATLLASAYEQDVLEAGQKDIGEIAQFIKEYYTFSIRWPFKHIG